MRAKFEPRPSESMALETRQIEGSNPTKNIASLQVMALKMTKTMAITIGEIIGK